MFIMYCLMIIVGYLVGCCGCQGMEESNEDIEEIYLSVSNRSPKEGDTVNYVCRVFWDYRFSRFSSEAFQTKYDIFLEKDGDPLTLNGDVYYDSRDRIQIEWTLSGIPRNHTGLHECVVRDTNNTRIYGRLGGRNSIEVSVRYYPSLPFPSCSSSVERVYLGSQVTLQCMSEEGNPSIDIRWRSHNEAINASSANSEQVDSRQDGFVSSALTLSTTLSDTNDVYTCEIYSSSFPNIRRNCSVTVQAVLSISIAVYPSLATVNTGDSIQFTCRNVEAPGFIEEWDWDTGPRIKEQQIVTSGDTLTISDISHVSTEDNGTKVYCFGLYDDQWFPSVAAMIAIKDSVYSTRASIETSAEIITTPPTPENQNQRSATAWMVGFVVVIVISVAIATMLTVTYVLKRKKTGNQNGHDVSKDPAVSAPPPTQSHDIKAKTTESSYTGLQLPKAQEQYTELNLMKSNEDPGATEDNEYAYAAAAENVATDLVAEDFVYDYADAGIIATKDKPHQPTYDNIIKRH